MEDNLVNYKGKSMRFVKTDNLKRGMRIGRPIYNKKGVLLYDRDSKLTEQSISSIRNFGLIGIFVLDAAEPLPPMTEADREFERFQTVNVYALDDELRDIISTKHARRLEFIANDIMTNYGHLHSRINFIQNIRSKEDFVCKHSLNVGILAAMMANRMNVPVVDRMEIMLACLVHDIGKLTVPEALVSGDDFEEIDRIYDNAQETGFEFIDSTFSNANIRRICAQSRMMLQQIKKESETGEKMKILTGTRILTVAETFDTMTAMSTTGNEEPKSAVEALRYLEEHPEVFNRKAVEALVDSVNILSAGTTVLLSNGEKALVISTNTGSILHPVVLQFSTNEMIDLSNRKLYDDLQITDIVRSLDERHKMSE